MFILGHVGIGTHLVPKRIREALPWRWLALGCLLPDLVDKPIWFALRSSAESALAPTARLFGHTIFFAALLAILAALLRKPALRALAWGVPTHLLLDVLSDYGLGGRGIWRLWLCWPWRLRIPRLFPPSASVLDHFAAELSAPVYVAGEIIGALLLLWDWRHRKSRPSGP